jgi:hypothetical protein
VAARASDPRAAVRPWAAVTTGTRRAVPIELPLATRRRGAARPAPDSPSVPADRRPAQVALERPPIPRAQTGLHAPTELPEPTGLREPASLRAPRVARGSAGLRARIEPRKPTGLREAVALRAGRVTRELRVPRVAVGIRGPTVPHEMLPVGLRAPRVARVVGLGGLAGAPAPTTRQRLPATVFRAPAQQGVTSPAAAALIRVADAAGTTIARASAGTLAGGLTGTATATEVPSVAQGAVRRTGTATAIELASVAPGAVRRTGTALARTARGGTATGPARVFLRCRPVSPLISSTRRREPS